MESALNTKNVSLRIEDAEKMARNLRRAITQIEKFLTELSNIKLSGNSNLELTLLKPKFSKYALIGDCTLEKNDSDILHMMSQIDMCYKLLLMKSSYTFGDVIYVNETMSKAKELFERKLEEVDELLRP